MTVNSNASNASSSEVWPTDTDTNPSTERPVARPKARSTMRDLAYRNLHISRQNCEFMEKVFDNVHQKLGRPEDDNLDQIDSNFAIWRIFMTTCMKGAVQLGCYHEEIFRVVRNTDFSELRSCSPQRKKRSSEHGEARCETERALQNQNFGQPQSSYFATKLCADGKMSLTLILRYGEYF